jgi:hypothetical protein
MKLKISFAVICSLLLLFSCSSKNIDPVTGKETSYEIDPQKRAKEYARQGGGLFGDINNKKSSGTTYDFATSNVLWRATLKSLDFLPLINADYSGGIIVYDWYSDRENSNEQIKITVKFLNNELRTDSIQVTAHKKICEDSGKCTTKKLDDKFSNDIKDTIITSARSLRIEETKKEKK